MTPIKNECDKGHIRSRTTSLQGARIKSATVIAGILFCVASTEISYSQGASIGNISFQGALTGTNGQPIPNGPYTLTFKFYDAPSLGNLMAISVVTNVMVSGGIASTPVPISPGVFGADRDTYLGVAISGISSGQELSPRILITAVPYAAYSQATRGLGVNPPATGPPIAYLRPTNRVVIGSTTEDISRIPQTDTALVIGTTNGAAGTTGGIYFDTQSRADSAIVLEKNSGTSVEDNTMHFYIGKEGDVFARDAMTITQDGNIRAGPYIAGQATYSRLIVGTSNGDADRMPPADEVLVVGTTNNIAGNRVGIYFDSNNRNGGGIVMEKVSNGSIEDHRMHFYVTKEGDISSHNYMTIYEDGVTEVVTLRVLGGADLAEPLTVPDTGRGFKAEPGMVVSIDPTGNRKFKLSDEPYDRKRVGIISGGNHVNPGLVLRDKGNPAADGEQPVALTGQVWCHADASYGAIMPGDLLTTSSAPGHAMKATNLDKARFAVIGQALTPLKEGCGWVQVFVGKQ